MRGASTLFLRVALGALVVGAGLAHGASPVDDQASKRAAVFARAFSYNRTLGDYCGDSVTAAVLFRPGDATSEASAEVWRAAFASLGAIKIKDVPFRVIKAPVDGSLATTLGNEGVDILFAPDAMDAAVSQIAQLARSRHIMSAGAKEENVRQGNLALGVFPGDDKMRIVVHLGAADAEDTRYSSQLLKLAEVIR